MSSEYSCGYSPTDTYLLYGHETLTDGRSHFRRCLSEWIKKGHKEIQNKKLSFTFLPYFYCKNSCLFRSNPERTRDVLPYIRIGFLPYYAPFSRLGLKTRGGGRRHGSQSRLLVSLSYPDPISPVTRRSECQSTSRDD